MGKRVQMDMSQRSFERLQALKETVDATSYSEVLRDALQLYDYFIEQDRAKKRFFIEDENGDKQELKIFM